VGQFRGVPLINTDTLLDFVDIQLEEGKQSTTLTLPFEIPGSERFTVMVSHEPEAFHGDLELSCSDLALVSPGCSVPRGYRLVFGSASNPEIMHAIFQSHLRSAKRTAERVDWGSFKRQC
jgi:hypothetical protein